MTEEDLFLKYRYLTQTVVRKANLKFRFMCPVMTHRDIQQLADIGLLKAIRACKFSYDDRRFYSYARTRINGAIVDEVRKLTHRGKAIKYRYLEETLEPGIELYRDIMNDGYADFR